MSGKRSFCILPFVQTVVRTDGMISACCSIPGWMDIKSHTIGDFWRDQRLGYMKQSMLADEPLEICRQCYDSEMQTGNSMRLDGLKQYHVPESLQTEEIIDHLGLRNLASPRYIEMHINNTCNLKCLTCRPEDSSMFLFENRTLGISDHRQADYQIPEHVIESRLKDLMDQSLDFLDLRGGESLLVPQVKKFLKDLPHDHKIQGIRLQTNGTIPLTAEWRQLLAKFPRVNMMMSVDAYNQDNHYIRYPAQWYQIEENFQVLKNMPNVNAWISCTLSNLNLPVVHKLLRWCRDQEIQFHWNEAVLPPYFHYSNLPSPIYDQARESLSQFSEFDRLMPRDFDSSLWGKFCDMIDKRDKHRRNSIFDMIPELRHYWMYT